MNTMRFCWVLPAMSAMLIGCTTNGGDASLAHAWCSLHLQPVELLGPTSERVAQDLQAIEFRKSAVAKGYFIYRGYSEGPYFADPRALLLDPQGKPIWAGSHAFVLRESNHRVGIFLLDKYGMESGHSNGMYRIGVLYIEEGKEPDYGYIGDGHTRITTTGECEWLADFDGDGSDELIVLLPMVDEASFAELGQIRWSITLFADIMSDSVKVDSPPLSIDVERGADGIQIYQYIDDKRVPLGKYKKASVRVPLLFTDRAEERWIFEAVTP